MPPDAASSAQHVDLLSCMPHATKFIQIPSLHHPKLRVQSVSKNQRSLVGFLCQFLALSPVTSRTWSKEGHRPSRSTEPHQTPGRSDARARLMALPCPCTIEISTRPSNQACPKLRTSNPVIHSQIGAREPAGSRPTPSPSRASAAQCVASPRCSVWRLGWG